MIRGAGLGEHEIKTILDYKQKHPSMRAGADPRPAQVFFGWRASVKAITHALREAGYAPVHRKGRLVCDEHPRRFEAPHRFIKRERYAIAGHRCAQLHPSLDRLLKAPSHGGAIS